MAECLPRKDDGDLSLRPINPHRNVGMVAYVLSPSTGQTEAGGSLPNPRAPARFNEKLLSQDMK